MGDKGASSSSSAQAEQPKPQSIAHYINKLKQGDNATWEKDELLNVIYWFHQVSGVLLGIVFALGDITGFMGVMLFWVTSVAITLGGMKSLLGIDDVDAYGGLFELIFEGMMGSFASFLVAWILTFSAVQ